VIEGTYITVFDDQSGSASVVAEDETRLDCAVAAYLDSGGTRDSLVHLTMTNGQRYVIRASAVQSWIVCTPEGRLQSLALQRASVEEDRAHKQELGIWED
jgi:hypothetical protein